MLECNRRKLFHAKAQNVKFSVLKLVTNDRGSGRLCGIFEQVG